MSTTQSLVYLADYINNTLYTGDGSNGLYLHDGSGSYGTYETDDNSIRYAGSNPNNYVCFGSDVSPCPSDNLYRIIGVFGNNVKLIINTTYSTAAWSSDNSNEWTTSTIRTTLNGTFLSSLGSYANYIENYTYYLEGYSNSDLRPNVMYDEH